MLTSVLELSLVLVEIELSAAFLAASVGISIIRIRLGISMMAKATTEAMAIIGFDFLRIFSRENIF